APFKQAAILAAAAGVAGEGQNAHHHQIVERHDAQSAAYVEALEVMRLALGFEQDVSDEEAAQDEKEIDANPASFREAAEDPAGRYEVVEQDGQCGERAQSVQFRDSG